VEATDEQMKAALGSGFWSAIPDDYAFYLPDTLTGLKPAYKKQSANKIQYSG
jgi:hypothetical protein